MKLNITKFLFALSLYLLGLYQKYLARLFPPCCRFYPTCSEYAKQAILKYGLGKGIVKGVVRLLRCHPFSGREGIDPLL